MDAEGETRLLAETAKHLLVPDGTYLSLDDKNFLVLSERSVSSLMDTNGHLRALVAGRPAGLVFDALHFKEFPPDPSEVDKILDFNLPNLTGLLDDF